MNAVTYRMETVGSDKDAETILHITVTSKAAAEMPDIYHLGKSQRQALAELLKPEYAQMLAELVDTYGDVGSEIALMPKQVATMLDNLPENLRDDRKAVVQTAYVLLGKVSCVWDGKSSAIGWDIRWGTPAKVTAIGSRTTGTIRP